MLVAILQEAQRLKVSLRMEDDRLLASPGVNVTLELGDAIRANRDALKAIVGSKSWPWLSDPAFVLGESLCRCGRDPWVYSDEGEPWCQQRVAWPQRDCSGMTREERA